MSTVFFICAVAGGAILAIQFVLTLLGMGADGMDIDIPDAHDVADGAAHDTHFDSSWLFGIISFRTVVAALTFFGLFGMTAESMGQGLPVQLLLALLGGGAALFGVHWLFSLFHKLNADGTVRIEGAIGKTGIVYVPIPANNEGAGKIQIKLQNRLTEYPAMTSAKEKLNTGARVVVVGTISQNTLEVEPVSQAAETVK